MEYRSQEKIDEADSEMAQLKAWLEQAKENETRKQRLEKLEHEHKLYEMRLKLQLELETSKAKSEISSESVTGSTNYQTHSGIEAKLPKLIIAKFDESYKDWPRIWVQYPETNHP